VQRMLIDAPSYDSDDNKEAVEITNKNSDKILEMINKLNK
jgi:hypothetical protein